MKRFIDRQGDLMPEIMGEYLAFWAIIPNNSRKLTFCALGNKAAEKRLLEKFFFVFHRCLNYQACAD